MKKTYIRPSVECFKLNAQTIIASSPLSMDEGVEITSGNEGNFEVLGREDNAVSNVWDSEW